MYTFDNGQISIHEFGQPIGMRLHEDNRWVKKTVTIPWPAIEKRYAVLFTNQKGNVAKPLRLGLGACIIQAEYGYSAVETTLQIQENPYLQYFCSHKAYDDSKPPFDPSRLAGGVLTPRQALRLEPIRKVYEQQKIMYDAHSHKVSGRIVSPNPLWC